MKPRKTNPKFKDKIRIIKKIRGRIPCRATEIHENKKKKKLDKLRKKEDKNYED